MDAKLNLSNGRVPDENLWNELSRAAYLVSDNILEAHSYLDARFRVIMVLLAVMFVFVAGFSPIYFGRADYPFETLYDGIHKFVDFEGWLRNRFDKGITAYSDFDDLLERQLWIRDQHFWYDVANLIAPLSLVFIPLLMALLSPRCAPVRIDLDLQIAYTWRRGKIWTRKLNGPDEYFFVDLRAAPYGLNTRAAHMDPWFGYARVYLQRPDGTKIKVGASAYPPTRHNHNDDVLSLLWLFADQYCDPSVVRENLNRTKFLPADILRALNKFSLRRVQSLDAPKVQAALEQALK